MKILYIPLLLVCVFFCSSCQKDFLEKKPDKALLVPTTLADLQALLDNTNVMNLTPALQLIAADDYTITDNALNSFTNAFERNSYLWVAEPYEGKSIEDWNACYKQIFYCNVVLEGLKKIGKNHLNGLQHSKLQGISLFYRAFSHFCLVQLFTAGYTNETKEGPGIPYRLSADVNIRTGRSTLSYTYEMIIKDLKEAALLLPNQSLYKGNPGKGAALALLARSYLFMGDYPKALNSADDCLKINEELMDFNLLSAESVRPIVATNAEVLFYTVMINYSFTGSKASVTTVNPDLYKSYEDNDLRKTMFFNNKGNDDILFKGNYSGSSTIFSGMATNEVYLTKAESEARLGNKEAAMATLNLLLKKRWKKDEFTPIIASSEEQALTRILAERRKELVCRGLRWCDLKRLNSDPRFETILKRTYEGKEYVLKPNDRRYVFPIPDDELKLSGEPQNER